MKMTITIHGICDDFADEIERDINNAIAYGNNGGSDMPPPSVEIETVEDDGDYDIAECRECHGKFFAGDLSESGLCESCEYEKEETK